jgi:hypothetical protein
LAPKDATPAAFTAQAKRPLNLGQGNGWGDIPSFADVITIRFPHTAGLEYVKSAMTLPVPNRSKKLATADGLSDVCTI